MAQGTTAWPAAAAPKSALVVADGASASPSALLLVVRRIRSGSSSAISTPASAFESGQVALARSAVSQTSSGSPSDSTRRDERDVRDPDAELERDLRADVITSGSQPAPISP